MVTSSVYHIVLVDCAYTIDYYLDMRNKMPWFTYDRVLDNCRLRDVCDPVLRRHRNYTVAVAVAGVLVLVLADNLVDHRTGVLRKTEVLV